MLTFSRSVQRRLIAFLLGLVALGISLEISLRVSALDRRPAAIGPQDEYDFVCVGNSHTAGIAPVAGRTYCDQLSKMLWVGDRPARGLNLGRLNGDTWRLKSVVKNHLPALANRYVFFMVGEANLWNHIPSADESIFENPSWSPRAFRFFDLMNRTLSGRAQFASFGQSTAFPGLPRDSEAARLKWLGLGTEMGGIPRLLKSETGRMFEEQVHEARAALLAQLEDPRRSALAQIGLIEMGDPVPTGFDWKSEKWSFLAAYLVWKQQAPPELVAEISKEEREHIQLAMQARSSVFQSTWNEVHTWQSVDTNVLKKYCGYDPNCMARAFISAYRFQPMLRPGPFFRESIELNPYPSFSWTYVAKWLETHLAVTGAENEVREELARVGVAIATMEDTHAWIKRDTIEMLNMTREVGGHVVLQGYPFSIQGQIRHIDAVIQEIADETGVEFLNSALYLQQAARDRGLAPQKFFIEIAGELDPHLNEFGNQVLTQQLCDWFGRRDPSVYVCR